MRKSKFPKTKNKKKKNSTEERRAEMEKKIKSISKKHVNQFEDRYSILLVRFLVYSLSKFWVYC